MGPFTTAKMEDTCFYHLTVKLGHPYLYMHQGDCEHVITFTDIRCVTCYVMSCLILRIPANLNRTLEFVWWKEVNCH